jgi:bacteriocin-associated integral membrane protein
LKWILVAFLALLSVASAVVSFIDSDNAERAEMQQSAASVARPFEIPNDPALADPTLTGPALQTAAESAQVNVFRTSVGYNADDQSEVTQFVLLTSDTTKFNDSFRLQSGRFLTPGESLNGTAYVSTQVSSDAEQVGSLSDLGANDRIFVRSLDTAFDSLPTAGGYYVECRNSASCAEFVNTLAKELNTLTRTDRFTAADFESSVRSFGGLETNSASILLVLTYVLVFFIAILLVYRQMYEAKRSGVLQLHGYGTGAVWFRVSGALVLATSLISGTVVVLASFFVPGVTQAFIGAVALTLIKMAVIVLLASLLTCFYIRRVQVSAAIKNWKETKLLFVTSTFVKAAFTMGLIVATAGMWSQFTEIQRQSALLGNWQSTSQFGIYYPTSVGNDLIELQTGRTGPTEAEVYDLYPVLNEMGSVFIDSTNFEPSALAQPIPPGGFRSLLVNPNYLQNYPVLDSSGQPVVVSENEADWVLLAPASLKSRSAEIVNYYTNVRTGGPSGQGVAQAERSQFGRVAQGNIHNQEVRIIWTADQQRVFSFNPRVAPSEGNTIDEPIIQVMTLANSAGVDRSNMITGAVGTGMKVKLSNGSTNDTQKQLQPLLDKLKLDDNLLHLVTMNDYALQQVQYLNEGIRNIALTAAGLLITMLVLAFQCLTLTFERYSRQIVVRRLFGIPFIQRYQEFLIIFVLIWGAQLAGASMLNALGVSPFATSTSSGAAPGSVVFGTAAVVFALELVFSAIALTLIEKKRTTDVLKGEF